MSVDPLARKTVLVYDGGTMTAPLGVLRTFYPNARPQWTAPTGLTLSGRRRKYGSRQRSNAAAGEAMSIRLLDGEIVTVRVTGSHTKFVDEIRTSGAGDRIVAIYSERGTWYGPRFIDED